MRQASRRQNSMRRESADTPLLQKLEIFSDQGISARRSLAHICAKDLGARFPTAEIPQRPPEAPPPCISGTIHQKVTKLLEHTYVGKCRGFKA